jgi:hypothetical protein
MARLDILLIAPESDLNLSEEIAAICTNHNCEKILSVVREVDIHTALRRFGYFDVVWFACHGGEDGVQLSATETLGYDAVVQIVNVARAQLLVINSCSSEKLALQVVGNGRTDVIYAMAPVANGLAVSLATLLASELAACQTFYQAFEIVAPEHGPYRYLAADEASLLMTRSYRRDDGELHDLSTRFADFREKSTLRSGINLVLIIMIGLLVIVLWIQVDRLETAIRNDRQMLNRIDQRLIDISSRMPTPPPFYPP